MTLKALVLCAGRGTRLEELTRGCPKPLLPIEAKPLVGYTLDLLARHGVTDVRIAVIDNSPVKIQTYKHISSNKLI